MYDFLISKEQAQQFAYDCFDVIIRDIKAAKEQELQESSDVNADDRKIA